MIGERLRAAREAKEMTLAQAAGAVMITHAALSYIERGERMPSVQTLARLAELYGVTMDELVHEKPA